VTITDDDWDEKDARGLSAICLCLVDDVLFVDEVGKSIYDEILDEQNLLEETVVQFADERRYKSC
jgi:hypothetical protein